MVQEWYEKGWFLYLMAGICGVGILSKFLLGWYFGRMVRNTENMWQTKKKWLKKMQQDYLECAKEFGKVHNVDIFVDKYVGNRKFLGIMISTWDKLGGQTMLVGGGIAIFATVTGVYYRCDRGAVLFTFFVGIWLVIMNLVVDNLANLVEKREQAVRNLKDYFINRMPGQEAEPEGNTMPEEAGPEGGVLQPQPEMAAAGETKDTTDIKVDGGAAGGSPEPVLELEQAEQAERNQAKLYVVGGAKQEPVWQQDLEEGTLEKAVEPEPPIKVVDMKAANTRKESKKEAAARKKRERIKRQAALELEQGRQLDRAGRPDKLGNFDKTEETAAAAERPKDDASGNGERQEEVYAQENGLLIDEVLREFL